MTKENCKVSIIIPVYNTEKYVRETVMSACSQTLQDIEIICVNDGATDKSEDILIELAKQDKRIHVINEYNSGQGVARNNGIINAKGDYIYFLDSDDLLTPDTLKSCYQLCEKNNYDFVTFDSDVYNPDNIRRGNNLKYDRSNTLYENNCYTGLDSLNLQLAKMTYTPLVQLLFINASFLKKSKICFRADIFHEDLLFTTLLYLQAKKTAYIHKTYFHRRIRSNSVMTNKFSWKDVQGYLTVADQLTKVKENLSAATTDILLSQMFNSIVRWEAYNLPCEERLYLAMICFTRYRHYIKYRSIFSLFAKSLLKKKY